MKIDSFVFAALLISAPFVAAKGPAAGPSDSAVRKQMIQESIAAYPGNCPCPYHAARNGSACGGRSAWSRRGGYAPLCYDKDISKDMVEEWRANHAISTVVDANVKP